MKKELTLGTPAVPAREMNFVTKIREQLNKALPADCQIKTARDAWYVCAICGWCIVSSRRRKEVGNEEGETRYNLYHQVCGCRQQWIQSGSLFR